MWRVYKLFHNPKLDRKMVCNIRNFSVHLLSLVIQLLKDHHIMVIILAVTGIAVLLLLLETAVPYLRGSITLERDIENLSGETVRNSYMHVALL